MFLYVYQHTTSANDDDDDDPLCCAAAQRCAPLRVFYGPSKTVSQSGPIQAFAKDLPVQCVRPRRLVTFA